MSDSPVKKLAFDAVDKENGKKSMATTDKVELKKALMEKPPVEKVVVAPTIKPDESDEPLLQENPHRFVLFPIKYHEVSGWNEGGVVSDA